MKHQVSHSDYSVSQIKEYEGGRFMVCIYNAHTQTVEADIWGTSKAELICNIQSFFDEKIPSIWNEN